MDDVIRDHQVRIPTFSGPTYRISKEYGDNSDLVSLFFLCNNFFNLACFAKIRYLYMRKILNVLPTHATPFFPIILQSMCNSVVMDVARLYDEKGLSIDDVRRKAEIVSGRPDLYGVSVCTPINDEIGRAREIFRHGNFKRLRKNLGTIRNKIYAHNDKDCCFNYDALLRDHGLRLYDLSRMIDLAGRICRTILAALSSDVIPAWSDAGFENYTSDVIISIATKDGGKPNLVMKTVNSQEDEKQ